MKDGGKHIVLYDDHDVETSNCVDEYLQYVNSEAINSSQPDFRATLKINDQDFINEMF